MIQYCFCGIEKIIMKKLKLVTIIAGLTVLAIVLSAEIFLQMYFFYYKTKYINSIIVKNKIFLAKIDENNKKIPENVKDIFMTLANYRKKQLKMTGIKLLDVYIMSNNRTQRNICNYVALNTPRNTKRSLTYAFENIFFAYYCDDNFEREQQEILFFNKLKFGNDINNIFDASKHYFDKNINNLTNDEVIELYVYYVYPFYSKNSKVTKMVKEGYLKIYNSSQSNLK